MLDVRTVLHVMQFKKQNKQPNTKKKELDKNSIMISFRFENDELNEKFMN